MLAVRGPGSVAVDRPDRESTDALASAGRTSAGLALMLSSGGDERIQLDAATGRNRYGTRTSPGRDGISFASTTANGVSSPGFAAARRALDRLMDADPQRRVPPEHWLGQIRARIGGFLGIAGSEVVLTASGTDAELIVLGLVCGLSRRPVTNIVVAPEETGSGVPMAAAGRHFLGSTALGARVAIGNTIDGFDPARIEVRNISIRGGNGLPRPQSVIDRDAARMVEQELRRGRDVLLHVLDTSKTGLAGITRDTARGLAASASGRIRVVVDACQLRCNFTTIKRDLADGFMVIATGSKFAGGPPFSGALLLPAATVAEIAANGSLPSGLAAYSTAHDWPDVLRGRVGAGLSGEANVGLGLRWIAALDAARSLAVIDDRQRSAIITYFGAAVRAQVRGIKGIVCDPSDAQGELTPSSIVALTVLDRDGRAAPAAEAGRIHIALRDGASGQVCHVGQPVRLGPRTVLRIAASAVDVAGIAARMTDGDMERAFRPVAADLDSVLVKWSAVARSS